MKSTEQLKREAVMAQTQARATARELEEAMRDARWSILRSFLLRWILWVGITVSLIKVISATLR